MVKAEVQPVTSAAVPIASDNSEELEKQIREKEAVIKIYEITRGCRSIRALKGQLMKEIFFSCLKNSVFDLSMSSS